jgi:hypothetical protein
MIFLIFSLLRNSNIVSLQNKKESSNKNYCLAVVNAWITQLCFSVLNICLPYKFENKEE